MNSKKIRYPKIGCAVSTKLHRIIGFNDSRYGLNMYWYFILSILAKPITNCQSTQYRYYTNYYQYAVQLIDLYDEYKKENFMKYSNDIFQDLFQTKAHIGTTTWEKMMSPFLIGSRNDIFIFNLELTLVCLKQVLKVLENIRKKNGHILFVNTSSKYSELVRNTAGKLNQSYVNDRWVGGTLTNWKQVSESIFLFKKFSLQFETFLKIYNIQIPVYQKAKKRYEGLNVGRKVNFTDPVQFKQTEQVLREQRSNSPNPAYLPDIIILINPDQNEILLQEAKAYKIPVIAFADSNTKNININYIIPGNTKSISFMYFCLNLFTIILQKNK